MEGYEDRAHKQIQIESWSNSARTLNLRGSTPGGPFAESHITNGDRSRATDTFELHGTPTKLQVSPSTGPVRRGECYVRVTLLLDGEPVLRLSSAYLTDSKTVSWPPGQYEGFTEGAGLRKLVTGTDPAANVEINEAVPSNAIWKIIGVKVALVADANVANRTVALIVNDGASNILVLVTEAVQTAGQTRNYNWFPLAPRETAFTQGQIEIPIPDNLILPAGWKLVSETTNRQIGDNYGAPLLIIEEWIQE